MRCTEVITTERGESKRLDSQTRTRSRWCQLIDVQDLYLVSMDKNASRQSSMDEVQMCSVPFPVDKNGKTKAC